MNPDGQPGITLHYDVGTPNPNPSDPHWGDWGGGGDCISDAVEGEIARDYKAWCAVSRHYIRNAFFGWGIDASGGGGQNNASGNCYWANTTANHVHELGHRLGLTHEGPRGSSAQGIGAANRRPTYLSRMNYVFSNHAQYSNHDRWEDISFSFGTAGQSSGASLTEIAPAGTTNLRPLSDTAYVANENSSGVWDVDWNLDGDLEIYREVENARNARGYAHSGADPDFLTGVYGDRSDAAVIGDALVFAYTRENPNSGQSELIFKFESDGECVFIPETSGTSRIPRYGDCMRLGTAWTGHGPGDVTSVSLAVSEWMSGAPRLVMVAGDYWAQPTVTIGGASEAQLVPAWALLPPALRGPFVANPVLVSMPAATANGVAGVMMFLQRSGGVLQQAYLPSGSSSWQGPVDVVTTTGQLLGVVSGDVGAVADMGQVFVAVRPSGTGNNVQLYSLPFGADENTPLASQAEVPDTDTALDLEIAITPPPAGSPNPEFFVFYRRSDDRIYQTRTSDFATWRSPSIMSTIDNDRAFAGVAVVYDDRALLAQPNGRHARGLRAFRDTHRDCLPTGSHPDGRPYFCEDPGYWPGRPSDLECDDSVEFCESESMPGLLSYIEYSPFATGLNPTEFCDYNDWIGIEFGICDNLGRRGAPALTTDFIRTPYQGPRRCRNIPVFPEPSLDGTCSGGASTAGAAADDRTTHPELYLPAPDTTCEH